MLRFPPPENENDFDWLVCAVAERKYGNTATRYGRRGQAQHGVDITLTGSKGEQLAIQSKRVEDLTEIMMDQEIDKLLGLKDPATRFKGTVQEFIFATSAKRDTKHTDHALALQQLHAPLRVSVWAWEAINEQLNIMPGLAGQYAAAVLTPYPLEETRKRHAQVLRLALNRPAVLDGFQYEFDFAKQAAGLRSIAGFINTGNLYDRDGVLVDSVPPYDADDDYRAALNALKANVMALARHIETRLFELQQYSLSPGGRQVDAGDNVMAKAYLEFELKRLRVLNKGNQILMTEALERL